MISFLIKPMVYKVTFLTFTIFTESSYPEFKKKPPNMIRGTNSGGAIANAVLTELAAVDIR